MAPGRPPPPEAWAPPPEAPTSRNASSVLDPSLASDAFVSRVPVEFARERLVISQGIEVSEGRECERVVFGGDHSGSPDPILAHNLAVRLGRPVAMSPAPAESVRLAVDALAMRISVKSRGAEGERGASGSEADPVPGLDERDVRAALEADERDLLKTTGRAPVVRLVNGLLFEALAARASDVHIQPAPAANDASGTTSTPGGGASGGGEIVVRFRVDGALLEARRLPRKLLEPIVSRVKVMAKLDIAEKRLPQDGRANVTIGAASSSGEGREVDLRVSTLPTARGERVVIRLLDKRNAEMFDLTRLGMPSGVRARFEELCARPYGMVLVTGPTGSGKTTTLYSALRLLSRPEVNILTLEDPIEYELPGISQAQINTKKGVTFATGLRHLLRQDPDVIMVGEIRDGETARTAVQAALTGHMVFSTLHTNDAASAVVRLVDLGVEPYLVNACVSAVLAQRLVRTLCAACGGTGGGGGGGRDPHRADAACSACRGGGFRGRVGLYELLVLDEPVKELVARGASAVEIERLACVRGMATLRQAGLALVEQGRTTREEVDRVTLAGEAEISAAEGVDEPVPLNHPDDGAP